jgi:hypothetical protein
MTHMTETGRTLEPRRRSRERNNAAWLRGDPSACADGGASRAFALRNDRTVFGGKGSRGRAIPKGEDS